MDKKKKKRLLERAPRKNVELIKAQSEAFSLSVEKLIGEYIDEIAEELKDATPSQMAAKLGSLVSGLRKAGLNKLVGRLQALYGQQLKEVERYFNDVGIESKLLKIDDRTVKALINFKAQEIENKVIDHVGRLRPIVLTSVIAGERPNVSQLRKILSPKVFANVQTEIRTGLLTFNRTMQKEQADKLELNHAYYVGGIIETSRDFCRDLLQKSPPIYTREEIEGMDNGQGLDVSTSGGGYNCIHHWSWITEEYAIELGWIAE